MGCHGVELLELARAISESVAGTPRMDQTEHVNSMPVYAFGKPVAKARRGANGTAAAADAPQSWRVPGNR
jgi:hypothetical protein